MEFIFTPSKELPEVTFVKLETFRDVRGSFCEVYRESVFTEHGIGPFVQSNYSYSRSGVLRGLHYQEPPMSVGKLVYAPIGVVFDVAVDVRPWSPNFGQYTCKALCWDSMIWIPPGFAHGFQVISENALVVYHQTQYYNKEFDRTVRWNDSDINICWPDIEPILSKKDANASSLRDIKWTSESVNR